MKIYVLIYEYSDSGCGPDIDLFFDKSAAQKSMKSHWQLWMDVQHFDPADGREGYDWACNEDNAWIVECGKVQSWVIEEHDVHESPI
jgi:hypothetical protein